MEEKHGILGQPLASLATICAVICVKIYHINIYLLFCIHTQIETEHATQKYISHTWCLNCEGEGSEVNEGHTWLVYSWFLIKTGTMMMARIT